MSGIKHVWFDFAGTLYRETPEYNEVHDAFRYSTYANLKGITNPEVAKHEFLELYEKCGSNAAVFRSLGQPSDYWMKALDEMDFTTVLRPDPTVYQTMDKLKDIVPVSLFTNFVRYRIDGILDHLQIPPSSFTHVITGDDIAERKPALDGFYAMIERTGIPAQQLLYVGDRVAVDVRPAKQVGIQTCLLYDTSPEADYCFDNFKDILSLFTEGSYKIHGS